MRIEKCLLGVTTFFTHPPHFSIFYLAFNPSRNLVIIDLFMLSYIIEIFSIS